VAFKRTLLTQEQFNQIPVDSNWHIDDVPRDLWDKIPGIERLNDTFAIMASGSVSSPSILNGINSIAGMDVLVHETNPMPSETPGNAYHYVFQETNDKRYPIIMHGPFRSETIIPHWFDAPDIDTYWSV